MKHRIPGLARRIAWVVCFGYCSLAWCGLWSTGYYPGYRQSYYAPSNIDFTALSHVIHFAVAPNPDGTLNTTVHGLTPAYSADLVTRAHTAGAKALICIGGAGSQAGFRGATDSQHLAGFVANVVAFAAARGYDGVDLDWEPLTDADTNQFSSLVNALRAAIGPSALLTAATASEPALFAALQSQFDQINLMTYDLAGPWPGWVTWFNSPIYDGNYRFASTGKLIPSSHGMVTNFTGNGVASGKLGIGMAFYGNIWTHGAGTSTTGTLLPRQSWTTAPTVTAVAYFDIMATYFQSNLYHWDTPAQAAYLSITNVVATNDIFLSYDDERSCQSKVSYARNNGLGGVMIWEIGQGYRPSLAAGKRQPLLSAVKQALTARPEITAVRLDGGDIELSFTTLPLGYYSLQCASNLAGADWTTLSNRLSEAGGVLQIRDPGAIPSRGWRFYRLQTPP